MQGDHRVKARVTVLMAVHNGERFLRPAIESVLQQQFVDFELLIVDDASTDGGPAILGSYHDSRVRVIRNNRNMGAGRARNLGLQEARNEYVAVLDADDVAYPHRLQEQVAFLDANSDIALVGGSYDVIDTEGRTITTMRPPTEPAVVRWTLLTRNPIANSACAFRRAAALAVGGYDEQLRIAEDYALYGKLAVSHRLGQLPGVVSAYRQHSGGLTGTDPGQIQTDTNEVSRRNISALLGRDVELADACQLSSRNWGVPASVQEARRAYRLMVECFRTFLQSTEQTPSETGMVFLATLGSLLTIADSCAGCRFEALRLAVRLGARHSPHSLHTPEFAGFVLRVLAPASRRRHLRQFLVRPERKSHKATRCA